MELFLFVVVVGRSLSPADGCNPWKEGSCIKSLGFLRKQDLFGFHLLAKNVSYFFYANSRHVYVG